MKKTYVIAEAGVNHNGSVELALRMITTAKELGADAIKFQLFKAKNLVTKDAQQAQYQISATEKQKTQFEMLKELELTSSSFKILHQAALKENIDFIITPFDIESLHFISEELNLAIIKISSGDITNGPLLLEAARTKKRIILSTGMCTIEDIRQALKIMAFGYLTDDKEPNQPNLDHTFNTSEGQAILQKNVILLHCTSEYPAPVEEVNLRAIDTMQEAFHLPVGLSDHTQGIAIALAASAREAVVIEKHFTLDKNMAGPDHKASLNPEELKEMITGIRNIEKALGDGVKIPTASEIKNALVVRRSIVAKKPIKIGDLFTKENIAIKRPSSGISPMNYWNILGKAALKNYCEDEMI